MYICKILLAVVAIATTACKSDGGATTLEAEWLKQKTLESLVFVEGGTFRMGDVGYLDEKGERQYFTNSTDNNASRDVTLSSYHIQKYEVTYRELDIYTEAVGMPRIYWSRRENSSHEHLKPDYPAKGMNWEQARGYCKWVGGLVGLPMDLATEAQWEYAARSRGKAVAYATDNGKYDRGRNVRDSRQNSFQMLPGTWPPNPLGLYDMTGNVDEWVLDWYMKAFPLTDEVDPKGPDSDDVKKYFLKNKVTRGGGVIGGESQMQLFIRLSIGPDVTGAGVGIRCVANHSAVL